MRIIFSVLALILSYGALSAQVQYANLNKACYKEGRLKVWFKNESKADAIAPNLSIRTDRKKIKLFEKYQQIRNDTLELIIVSKADASIFSFETVHGGHAKGKVSYEDKVLKSGKKFKTSVPVSIPDNVLYLKIFDDVVRINIK